MEPSVRHLILVLGDQLDARSAAFDGFDAAHDAVWMAEVSEESTHVWSHPARITMFLAAMRHFRAAVQARGWKIHYHELAEYAAPTSLAGTLAADLQRLRPRKLIMVEAGDWRVAQALEAVARAVPVPLEVRTDRHFFSTRAEFAAHAQGRKQLRLEFFYRAMRRQHGVLMEGDQPVGGQWNYDEENRRSFGPSGPGDVPAPVSFPPDQITRAVLKLVERRFASHPGSVQHFDWPVTPEQARAALADFLQHRLPQFGTYQDAMWLEPEEELAGLRPRHSTYLFHSRLSAALNLKLLNPREVIAAVEKEYRAGRVTLASAEGFIRQILGWREYVRGVYWHFMPDYLSLNTLNATRPLPAFFWTGQTDLRCLRAVLGQTLAYGYAHHIQRLMVTGLFTLLLGVRPQAVHEWYLAVYVDAVEWVELPNTLGMSQFADGGIMASKPYVASGKYIQRMSNYCAGCRFDPAQSTGPRACPFTTLYWDFLLRHQPLLAKNQRMSMQLKNLARLSPAQQTVIRQAAVKIQEQMG